MENGLNIYLKKTIVQVVASFPYRKIKFLLWNCASNIQFTGLKIYFGSILCAVMIEIKSSQNNLNQLNI